MPNSPKGIVAELVAEYLMRIDAGESDVTVRGLCTESLCDQHPGLLAAVERGVARAQDLPRIQAASGRADRRIGTVLGDRYRVGDRLGAGAMGVVYRAQDLDLGREVAVKVVHVGLLDREQALARFEREAAALAAVSHPNVVTIYDRGVADDGAPFLIMEYIEGVSCSEILDRTEQGSTSDDSTWVAAAFDLEPFPESSLVRQAVRWAADLANGLQAAHDKGIFHRDVKPSNVMIRKDGQAVLLDFGIAALDQTSTLTQTDAAIGTPAYMAPEVLGGRLSAHPSQDVYGLSATLYHLLTLTPPYAGSPSQVLTALATREPVPAVKLRPGLPRDAQAILDHGLARNRAKRYPSARKLEKDLRALLRFEPVSVRPTSDLVRTARRFVRSKIALGAAAALLVMGLVSTNAAWRRYVQGEAKAQFEATWPAVPANIGIVKLANRVIHTEEGRASVEAALDALVACDHQRVPSLLIRSMFRWDHGDRTGSTDDLGRLASLVDSEYSSVLSSVFMTAAATGDPPNFDGLPEPITGLDCYLAGYTALRERRLDDANRWLDDERLPSYRHAEELRFVLRTVPIGRMPDKSDEKDLALEVLLEDVSGLEARSGFKSATTCHLRGYAHGGQGELERAFEASKQALGCSPQSLVAIENLSRVGFDMHEIELVRPYLRHGLELFPGNMTLTTLLAKVHVGLNQHGSAMEIVERMKFPPSTQGQQARLELVGFIEVIAAIRLREVDEARAIQHARNALEAVTSAPNGSAKMRQVETFARAVTMGDGYSLFRAMLAALEQDPDSPTLLGVLHKHWPSTLSPEDAALVRAWGQALNRKNLRRRSRGDSELLKAQTTDESPALRHILSTNKQPSPSQNPLIRHAASYSPPHPHLYRNGRSPLGPARNINVSRSSARNALDLPSRPGRQARNSQ